MTANDPSPGFATLRLEVADQIATITLNRPDRLNAFNAQMMEDMVRVFDHTDADDRVRVIIVTGAGRGFCAGADLDPGSDTFNLGDSEFTMPRDADGGGIVSRRIFDSTKPVIAAINGPAVGIGMTMTLPMDVRMVADDARMGFVFVKRGLTPEAASSFFLPRVVGISQAAEWIYTGRIFDAEEARRAGLVRSVHPRAELLGAARELALEMAANTSPVATAIARRMIWQMLADGSPAAAHHLDSEAIYHLTTSPEMQEGIDSFLEKRPPDFPLMVSRDLPDFYRRWQHERGGLIDPQDLNDADVGAYARLPSSAAPKDKGGT